ncbi:GGDEF domain-containing protein [Polynucleobacter difficilis]|uniref:GGDEF domain-containing protein n=1 Tax=Polynucleobacter difficilis TaxID=556054 RepID=UPI000D333C43|nr:GGDEF domain-containing protein [Polynucleobacter difficilis]
MTLGLLLYFIALCAQIMAAFYAIRLFLKSHSYRFVCGFFAIGLVLMMGRRISPMLYGLNKESINIVDAWLSIPISISLLLGMIYFKKLLFELEVKNTALEEISKKDSLTPALNHSTTMIRAELEVKRSFRSQKCIAFLMLDIDHFKLVNDTHGHLMGDQVLVNLATLCQKELREINVFGRVGGEEFLIVLPETNQALAVEVANRLRIRIEESEMATVAKIPIFITVSIGISIFDPQQGKHSDASAIVREYYGLCDSAMYHAKQAGRNQVYCEPNFSVA